jgi:hypothetical protein
MNNTDLLRLADQTLNASLLGRGCFPSVLTDDEKASILATPDKLRELCESFAATRRVVI